MKKLLIVDVPDNILEKSKIEMALSYPTGKGEYLESLEFTEATPPYEPWICEDCGGEIPEEDVEQIATATRYVYTILCPHCAAAYYDRQRETAELIMEEYK